MNDLHIRPAIEAGLHAMRTIARAHAAAGETSPRGASIRCGAHVAKAFLHRRPGFVDACAMHRPPQDPARWPDPRKD